MQINGRYDWTDIKAFVEKYLHVMLHDGRPCSINLAQSKFHVLEDQFQI